MRDLTIDGFAEHAERMAEDPDYMTHAVPCPCLTCQAMDLALSAPPEQLIRAAETAEAIALWKEGRERETYLKDAAWLRRRAKRLAS